jgi:hypothetical protein
MATRVDLPIPNYRGIRTAPCGCGKGGTLTEISNDNPNPDAPMPFNEGVFTTCNRCMNISNQSLEAALEFVQRYIVAPKKE